MDFMLDERARDGRIVEILTDCAVAGPLLVEERGPARRP